MPTRFINYKTPEIVDRIQVMRKELLDKGTYPVPHIIQMFNSDVSVAETHEYMRYWVTASLEQAVMRHCKGDAFRV